MKSLLFLALVCSAAAFAKKPTSKNVGADLLKEVSADVKKDDSVFQKQGPSRGPASVQEASPTEVLIRDQKASEKIDRNMNQIGKPSW